MADSQIIANNRRPKRDFHGIALLGMKAHNLALAHQAEVEKRLPQGMLTALKTDLVALGVAVPAAKQARIDAEAATDVRDKLLVNACLHLTAMRKTVRSAAAPKNVQRAYGAGRNIDPRNGTGVMALVGSVLKRLEDHSEEIAEFCFTPEDVDALKTVRANLGAARQDQQEKLAGAPLSTKERNIVANRIQRAVFRISGAGALAFATQAEIRAEFEALHINPPAKPAKKKTAAQAQPTKTAAPSQNTAAPAQPTPAPVNGTTNQGAPLAPS